MDLISIVFAQKKKKKKLVSTGFFILKRLSFNLKDEAGVLEDHIPQHKPQKAK